MMAPAVSMIRNGGVSFSRELRWCIDKSLVFGSKGMEGRVAGKIDNDKCFDVM
jgi:hypothetical protein